MAEEKNQKENQENPMRSIRIEKVTLNCGTSTDQARLEKAMALLKMLTNRKPVKNCAKRRLPAFGIHPKLPIGCKVTLRGKEAIELLKRLLETIGNTLKTKQINPGSFAFGIKEYIEIPNVEYRREIGIMGFDVCVTLERHGFRVKRKKLKHGRLPPRHTITKEETINFMEKNFNTAIEKGRNE